MAPARITLDRGLVALTRLALEDGLFGLVDEGVGVFVWWNLWLSQPCYAGESGEGEIRSADLFTLTFTSHWHA